MLLEASQGITELRNLKFKIIAEVGTYSVEGAVETIMHLKENEELWR